MRPNVLTDFETYASTFLRIKTQKEAIIPFIFNSTQRKLHALWEKIQRERGYVMIIVLKARREGISTYCEGRIFHKCVTSPNVHGFIMAHDSKSLDTIFNMSKLFYDELPQEMRPMLRYSSKKELVFENPSAKDRLTNPGLRSRIEVVPARNSDSLRSGGYSAAHFSEVAFYDDAESILGPYVPTFSKTPGSFVIFESTANGVNNFFHNEWKRAKKGKSNFVPIFFSWLEFSDFSLPPHDPDEAREIEETLDDEEQMLRSKFGATLAQLHWRRHTLMDLHGDVELFHQEYPTTDDEAFISSGRPYFSRDKIRHLQSLTKPPIFVGDVTNFGFIQNDDGPLQLWEEPTSGCYYSVGIDVGSGTEDGDASVIEVLKAPYNSPKIVQVAEWRGWVDPVILAAKAIFLARYYNEALVCPEVNNHGIATLNELKEHYWNIYQWQYFDHLSRFDSKKLGWVTNVATKPLLCDYTAACINSDLLEINSAQLLSEMMTFIVSPTGTGEADASCYDDCVMAFMIALFTLSHTYREHSLISKLNLLPSPKKEDEKPKRRIDWVAADLLAPSPSTENEWAWLNY